MAEDDVSSETLPELLSRGVALAERLVAENVRLRAETREAEEENHELASLYIAARQMHGSHEPRSVLGAVTEILLNFIGAKTFVVYLRDETEGVLRAVAAHGLPLEDLPPLGPDSVPGRVARSGKPLLVDELVPADPEGPPCVAIPLCLDDEGVGAIAVWAFLAHKTKLHDVDRALLDLISTHAARALEAARLAAGASDARLDYASLADYL
jgi:nitrate/nitrite-specific signal transduction histidine kinase